MKVGLFNPYFDTMGGGERYFFTVAEFFLKRGDSVDLFWQGEGDVKGIINRFGLDLKGVNFVENIFDGNGTRLQRYLSTLKYDVLFFVSDGSIPISFAKKTIIHFQIPFTKNKLKYFNRIKLQHALAVCNSQFTKNWIDRSYGIDSSVIYPPVDIESFTPGKKENIILAVGRFFAPLHPKKQEVMVEAFKRIRKSDWELVLIGGVTGDESQKMVDNLKKMSRGFNIKIQTDSSFENLRHYYSKAKLFWHAAGYGEDLNLHPERAEHFGITTVEAMAAGCAPLVFSGGGQREIVEDNGSGCLWTSLEELIVDTKGLMEDEDIREKIAKKAVERAKTFSKEKFFDEMEKIV